MVSPADTTPGDCEGTRVWFHLTKLEGTALSMRLAHSSTRIGSYLFVIGGVKQEYDSALLLNLGTFS